jgi:hypothetical protein
VIRNHAAWNPAAGLGSNVVAADPGANYGWLIPSVYEPDPLYA